MVSHRFAECFQFDPHHPGTPIQEEAVRESLSPEFGSNYHRLLQRLDREVNRTGRHYLTVGFVEDMQQPGLASPAGFNLSAAMGRTGCMEVARHELGHIVDFRLLTVEDRTWFMGEMGRDSWPGAWEAWAEAFRQWIDGTSWQSLTPILLPDAA